GGPAGGFPGLRLPCRQARAYEPIEVEARGVGMQPGPVSDVPHPEWAARRPQQIENPCAALPELSTGVGCDECPDVHERTLLRSASFTREVSFKSRRVGSGRRPRGAEQALAPPCGGAERARRRDRGRAG